MSANRSPVGRVDAHVEVAAPAEKVFAAATDWPRQGEWMLGTSVRVRSGDGRSVGSELQAVTGILGVGVTDSMRITVWDAPTRCEVAHTGRVIRGKGIFQVHPRGRDRATFTWTELLDLPAGGLAALAWPLIRPAVRWGLHRSLDRFVEFCRTYPG
jgi:carbon monoxide dehydrogenase subunit G